MKNLEQTANAITMLLENAETPFEKHRIEVLIRDLTEGAPQPTYQDETHQIFDGLRFRKIVGNKFQTEAKLHRVIYRYHFGDIPDNCLIRFADDNPLNFNIENLICVPIKK